MILIGQCLIRLIVRVRHEVDKARIKDYAPKLEIRVRLALHAAGLRYLLHDKDLRVKLELVF